MPNPSLVKVDRNSVRWKTVILPQIKCFATKCHFGIPQIFLNPHMEEDSNLKRKSYVMESLKNCFLWDEKNISAILWVVFVMIQFIKKVITPIKSYKRKYKQSISSSCTKKFWTLNESDFTTILYPTCH